jgi:hypothetical protein
MIVCVQIAVPFKRVAPRFYTAESVVLEMQVSCLLRRHHETKNDVKFL